MERAPGGRVTVVIGAVRVLTGREDLGPGWVEMDGGTITALGPGDPPRPADITLPAGTLAPGLVDAQLNGAFGIDLPAADEAGWRIVVQRLPESGVTAFVPSIITAPVATYGIMIDKMLSISVGPAAMRLRAWWW